MLIKINRQIIDVFSKNISTTCVSYRPLSRRLDRCDRVIQNESRDPFGGNVYYVTMQITFLTHKFRNGERNLHCDVVHITTKWVSSLTLDCNGVFAIKAYCKQLRYANQCCKKNHVTNNCQSAAQPRTCPDRQHNSVVGNLNSSNKTNQQKNII